MVYPRRYDGKNEPDNQIRDPAKDQEPFKDPLRVRDIGFHGPGLPAGVRLPLVMGRDRLAVGPILSDRGISGLRSGRSG